jgi:hypothetical protein
MDIEPLGIIRAGPHLHLYTHNLLGALLIALLATPIGKVMSEFSYATYSNKQTGRSHGKWQLSVL